MGVIVASLGPEFLVDPVVGLGDNFVGVVNEAAAETGGPGPGEAAAFSPAVHALAVGGHLCVVFVCFWEMDVFGFAVESVAFVVHVLPL